MVVQHGICIFFGIPFSSFILLILKYPYLTISLSLTANSIEHECVGCPLVSIVMRWESIEMVVVRLGDEGEQVMKRG